MPKIVHFESLRGVLALWVLIGHAGVLSGFKEGQPGVLYLPTYGFIAVEVFIILSGFVITKLLVEKGEDFRSFLTRRFFRLYPAFLLGLAIACLEAPWRPELIASLPFGGERLQEEAQAAAGSLAHLDVGLASHLLLIHAALPNEMLGMDGVNYWLLGPAWSISAEWCYYCAAPLLALCLFRCSRRAAAATALLTAGSFLFPGNLVLGLFKYFLLGAIFAKLYAERQRVIARLRQVVSEPALHAGFSVAVLLCCAVLLSGFVRQQPKPAIAISLWLLVFLLAVFREIARPQGPLSAIPAALSRALASRPLAYVGMISYSVYILHQPIVDLLALALSRLGMSSQGSMYVLLASSATAVTLLLANVTYHRIEKPAMDYARRLVKRRAARRLAAPGGRRPALSLSTD